MILLKSNKINNVLSKQYMFKLCLRFATNGCIGLENKELNSEIKHKIEQHWRKKLNSNEFNTNNLSEKYYVLSMFPYPSGNLHMGHVRVYSISDAIARFYRMNGKNVLHPMGWDAFGLPAENAALERNIAADTWTQNNIENMKKQFEILGCSFDWNTELTTCQPDYYKWTQWLFLRLYKEGLVYQKEAMVNWDPIDQTVLADEQVDENGCSWRSGAKVEKKLLKQWFIRTTKFAKALVDGLDDATLVDWRDIINLQKHWLGDCNGFTFDLTIKTESNKPGLKFLTIWTENPEYLKTAAFIAVPKRHILNKENPIERGILRCSVINPFNENKKLPILVTDDIELTSVHETYLGVPAVNETDLLLAQEFNIPINSESNETDLRGQIISKAKKLNIGGYLVSSKLKDWLISRQRHWGTPIPIVHCPSCGPVPVGEKDLPVLLPTVKHSNTQSDKSVCPKCGNANAQRESDTMDTFVDSSWYFLRFIDSNNHNEIFDKSLISKCMPVDLYIGGKEHAVLHLYYARFINHFLHSIGLVEQPEPFQRLLVQGMVMGRSYRVKGTGKYLKESEVKITNAKKNQAEEITTNKQVVMQWEKMSKSKYNGVDPNEVIAEHGTDTVRLIILGDVAPTSHRNWSSATFPGILNWQKRLWFVVNNCNEIRQDSTLDKNCIGTAEFQKHEQILFDARNYFIKETTFNYRHSHQLSVSISKMQGLTNAIRKAPKDVIKYGEQFERALATVITMLAPMAPHFASELWSQFLLASNRVSPLSETIKWDLDVLQQRWPKVDKNYKLDLLYKLNNRDMAVGKFTESELSNIDHDKAMNLAFENDVVKDFVYNNKILRTKYVLYPGCEAHLFIFCEHGGSIKKFLKQ